MKLMQRTTALIAAISFFAFSQVAVAASGVMRFVEGEHYNALAMPVATDVAPGAVEVVEVFSYLCIHCYSFDPLLNRWQQRQTEDVQLNRVPAVFSPDWEIMAQAFYTAEALGVGEKLHVPYFNAIHADRANIRDQSVLAELANRTAGVETDQYTQVFNAFSVKGKVMQAKAKTRAYGITGVPTMIVNGKYVIDAGAAGSFEGMLEIVDFLVDKERAAQ